MSDTERRDRKDRGRPLPVSPDATNPELSDWMERLFDGEFPAKLVLVEIHGRSGVLVRGFEHDHQDFKPTQAKPEKQYFVDLSNRFLAAAQRDCNMRRRPQNYVVEAYNTLKGADPYSRFPLPLQVTSLYLKAVSGKYADEDDGDNGSDPLASDRLLKRIESYAKDHREMMQMLFLAFGQSLMVFASTNLEQREHIDRLMGRWIEATEAREKAESGRAERDLAMETRKFWLKQLGDGAHLVKGLVPLGMKRLLGAEVMPINETPEAMVLVNFIKSLTEPQQETLFGKWSDGDKPELIKPGIFTVRQAKIIDAVARGEWKPTELYRLLEGDDAITPQQIAAAQKDAGITDNQLTPIKALLMTMMEQKLKATKE